MNQPFGAAGGLFVPLTTSPTIHGLHNAVGIGVDGGSAGAVVTTFPHFHQE